jgi:hypothetical protein
MNHKQFERRVFLRLACLAALVGVSPAFAQSQASATGVAAMQLTQDWDKSSPEATKSITAR